MRRDRTLVLALACVISIAGCLESGLSPCGDLLCPAGLVCDPGGTRCVLGEQVEACSAAADGDRCSYSGVPEGTCIRGVCVAAGCGNGEVEPPEVCDDGNQADGDGCAADCLSLEVCGNGIVDTGEACDDGNTDPDDACEATCVLPRCGDHIVNRAFEDCDDGGSNNHDGCTDACRAEHPTWHDQTGGTPNQRSQHAMAYDAAHQRIVMFGGYNGAIKLGDTWEWNGATWIARTSFDHPSPRYFHAMAYDVARGRTVLFGGLDESGQQDDVWEWDGIAWRHISTPTPRPMARYGAAMAYDARRGRTVLFGGMSSTTAGIFILFDTWEWDGETWTEVPGWPPELPSGSQQEYAMTYDPVGGRVLNYDCSGGGLWGFNGAAWTVVDATAPVTGSGGCSLNWDARRRRAVLHATESASTWEWDGTSWSSIATPGSPSARIFTAAAYDDAIGAIVSFGGRSGATTRNDTTVWDGAAWVTPPAAVAPARRRGPAGVVDPIRDRFLIVGGEEFSIYADAWTWHGGTWTQLASAPTQRADAGMTFDVTRRRAVLFGGRDSAGALADTWELDGDTWSAQTPLTAPSPRSRPSLAYDLNRTQTVLFGGVEGATNFQGDTWIWDGGEWSPRPQTLSPSPRTTAMVYDASRDRVVLFGGLSADGYLADTWEWDGTTWADVTPATGSPPARGDHIMTYDADRRRVVMHGGRDTVFAADAWEWDGVAWRLLPVLGPTPLARGSHAGGFFPGAGIILFGGAINGGLITTGGDTWTLRHEGGRPAEACSSGLDGDGDGVAGCADPDCWFACTPLCPPPASTCPPVASTCGDGECVGAESCRICPDDCGACAATCGDFRCVAADGEDASTCPGDCAP